MRLPCLQEAHYGGSSASRAGYRERVLPACARLATVLAYSCCSPSVPRGGAQGTGQEWTRGMAVGSTSQGDMVQAACIALGCRWPGSAHEEHVRRLCSGGAEGGTGRLLLWACTALAGCTSSSSSAGLAATVAALLDVALERSKGARTLHVPALPGAHLLSYGLPTPGTPPSSHAPPSVKLWSVSGPSGQGEVSVPYALPTLLCTGLVAGDGAGGEGVGRGKGRPPYEHPSLLLPPPPLTLIHDPSPAAQRERAAGTLPLAALAQAAGAVMGMDDLWPCLLGCGAGRDGRRVQGLPSSACISLQQGAVSTEQAQAAAVLTAALIARHSSCPSPTHIGRAAACLESLARLAPSLPALPALLHASHCLSAALAAYMGVHAVPWLQACLGAGPAAAGSSSGSGEGGVQLHVQGQAVLVGRDGVGQGVLALGAALLPLSAYTLLPSSTATTDTGPSDDGGGGA